MNSAQYFDLIHDIASEDILFKNSPHYQSSDWRPLSDCTTVPVQRTLTSGECVFDFDGVSNLDMKAIPLWLRDAQMKFAAFRSSSTGMHIHFWTNVHGTNRKKALVRRLAAKIEEVFGVKNDLQPMSHGVIRTEYANHPVKGEQKVPLDVNIPYIDPINVIPSHVLVDLGEDDSYTTYSGVTGNPGGLMPKCMRYILSHQFSDGRDRLLFSIVSWFKASGKTDQEIFDIAYEWCKRQDYHVSPSAVMAKIQSSSGQVGCRFRHELLEELGIDIMCNKKLEE